MSIDIEKICRTCLGLNGPLLSIYDSSNNGSGTGCIADMLSDFTKTKPKRDDNMPEKICLTCVSEINRSYSFKLKCEQSNRTLRQFLPDAVPEEFETIPPSKVKQIDQEVQTSLYFKMEKFDVKTQQTQTPEQAIDEEILQLTSPNTAHKRAKTNESSKQPANASVATKKKNDKTFTEEIILEILDDAATPDCEMLERQERDKQNVYSVEDSEEHTSYYELSDSQADYNSKNAKSSIDQQLTEYDENEIKIVKKKIIEEDAHEPEEYEQIVYTAATDADLDEADFNFTIYDDGEWGTQVVPKYRTKKSSTGAKLPVYPSATEKQATAKCPECDTTFVSKKTLRRHLIKRHNWKPEHIEIKQEDLGKSSRRLRSHKVSDNEQDNEKTSDDQFSTEIQDTLYQQLLDDEHLEKRTDDVDDPDYAPESRDSMEEVFASVDSGQVKDVRKTGADVDMLKLTYFCNRCNAGFARHKSLIYHQKQSTCTAPNYKCSKCERVFISKRLLDEHDKTHVFSHTCTDCNRVYSSAELLTQHMVEDHKRDLRNQCGICKKVFTMLSTLRDHMRTHSGEKPFVCSLCNKGFSQNANLRQHIMRHNKDKNHKCDSCTSSFVTKAELMCHKRKHTGDTPFKCEFCNAEFTTSSSLLKHRRKHTGERPYGCDICPLRFASLNVLKNHRRTHTGEKPYKCSYCNKAFTQKGDCQIHERNHTGERQYSCFCGRNFMHMSTLRTHMKVHNNNEFDNAGRRRLVDDDDQEQKVKITIVKMNEEDEDVEQHEMDMAEDQQDGQIDACDEELMQMNIEMC